MYSQIITLIYLFLLLRNLNSCNNWLLDEGGRQEALQVEEGNLLVILYAQDLAQLGIGDDDALVGGVVQIVLLDVSVDTAGYISAGDLGTLGNTEEFVHLISDLGRLGEAVGVGASVGTFALGLLNGLLHALVLLGESLQQSLGLLYQCGEGVDFGNQLIEGRNYGWLISGDWCGLNDGGNSLWCGLLGNYLLGRSGDGGRGSNGGSSLLYGSHRDLL